MAFDLDERHIDDFAPTELVIIGAGLAGILAGILLPAKVPNLKLTIYEKNEGFGGTWIENKYPGVRCDIPGDVYQASFAPKLDWSETFPRGQEVQDYWASLAEDYNVRQYVEFSQKIQRVEWLPAESTWELTIVDLLSGTERRRKSQFVFTAIGRFNDWQLPKIPGLDMFEGDVAHTASWPDTLDVKDKHVAVIGNGSSGIQILPSIQPLAKRIDHYVRQVTWIAGSWAGDDNSSTDAMAERAVDAATELKDRKALTDKYWRRFDTYMAGTEANIKLREDIEKSMKASVEENSNIIPHEIPSFPPNCRRLTPGPGYIKAVSQPNVNYIRTGIKSINKTGVEADDGVQRDVDIIVCATGFNIDMAPPFPVISGERDLGKAWKHDGEYGYPFTYLGHASPGFPNLFFIHGPHGTGLSGLVPHSMETQLTYFAKVLRKVSREGIKTITPSLQATKEFQEYVDVFFSKSVLSKDCKSWYNGGKPGGKIHGLWPGSAAHATLARQDPRWEDYEYEYKANAENRFVGFFGNGRTLKEMNADSDMTDYLQPPGKIDLKCIHEQWWRFP